MNPARSQMSGVARTFSQLRGRLQARPGRDRTAVSATKAPVQLTPAAPAAAASFTTAPTLRRPVIHPVFSSGGNEAQLTDETEALLNAGWRLDSDNTGVEKTFYFSTYTKVRDFVDIVMTRSKYHKHHPTITLKIGSAHVHWTTHNPRGLSAKDTHMAQFCDTEASVIGVVDESQSNSCKPPPKV